MERLPYAPLLPLAVGVLVAASAGLPSLNRRLTVTKLSWLLVLAPPLASAAYRVGIPQSRTFCDDLAQVVEQSHSSVEKNVA